MSQSVVGMAGVLAVLVGLVVGNPTIMVPGMLLLTVSAAAYLWAEYLPRQLKVKVHLKQRRVRWGEMVSGEVELNNDQPFPIPFVECSLEWPEELPAPEGQLVPHYKSRRLFLQNVLALRWFERVVRPFKVDCRLRGEHSFGPLVLSTADPFGLFSGTKTLLYNERLLVYPKTVPVHLGRSVRSIPFGEQGAPSWIFDDPARFRGSREYRPADPFSRIEWKATARTGQLHTRVFDASFATEVALVVNLKTGEQAWEGIAPEVLELTVTVAASVVEHCYRAGYRFGVYTNGFVRNRQSSAALRMGSGERHWVGAMELLARVLPSLGLAPERIVATATGRINEHAQLVVITARITPSLRRELRRQQAHGRRLAVLYTGEDLPLPLGGIPVFTVAEKEAWHELSEITLVRSL